MDEEIDRMILSVRADTQGFAQDVETMRSGLDGPLASGAERAGRTIERSLLRAVQTGKFGFEDLRRVAMSAMDAIARDALRGGLDKLFGGSSSSGGGLGGFLGGLAGSLFGGAPGRATGGPVSPGRAYRVGERGPELFVPTSSGRVVAAGGGTGGRDVRVTINVNSPDAGAPQALARSARQIARNVRTALSE